MDTSEVLPLGVVVERRRIDNPWKDFAWRPVAVIPGAPPLDPEAAWKVLREGEDWIHYHCGTLPLELFRRETEGYKVNLTQDPPQIFVLLRSDDDPDSRHDFLPFLVTASPYEAQDYLDSGEEIVEGVTMPADLIAFVQAFIDTHHVDEVFHKRRRQKARSGDDAFSRRPPIDTARAGRRTSD
ncbi:DUF3305 domain-containing protein [Pelagibius litoralis]|uniref:DUF3305 domain-containing protein n=1 Tax=Pelagibius litoralis TaxID=374515 RepID=A0A967EY09_9PROT|nr:DUF3305 domain-containing protein [Pelagibius litoralis]NIA69517.1 DUF3305 domain-containing protein [Pelagibius litoralis]